MRSRAAIQVPKVRRPQIWASSNRTQAAQVKNAPNPLFNKFSIGIGYDTVFLMCLCPTMPFNNLHCATDHQASFACLT